MEQITALMRQGWFSSNCYQHSAVVRLTKNVNVWLFHKTHDTIKANTVMVVPATEHRFVLDFEHLDDAVAYVQVLLRLQQ